MLDRLRYELRHVANLSLARAFARRRETALRLALGARRERAPGAKSGVGESGRSPAVRIASAAAGS
jgi:hypothetical protein